MAKLALVTILGCLGALHVVWAVGSPWPARDHEVLGRHVIGRGVVPSALPCLVVAGGLALFAWAFASESVGLARLVCFGATGVFAIRGVLGFFEPWLRPAIVETPYELYSRYMYSPLCLLIAALGAETLR